MFVWPLLPFLAHGCNLLLLPPLTLLLLLLCHYQQAGEKWLAARLVMDLEECFTKSYRQSQPLATGSKIWPWCGCLSELRRQGYVSLVLNRTTNKTCRHVSVSFQQQGTTYSQYHAAMTCHFTRGCHRESPISALLCSLRIRCEFSYSC
jgi:hypothetical protein